MNKYHAKKIEVDGHTFDSKAEARRYQQLRLMQMGGEISGLELQRRFVVFEKGAASIEYVADFCYRDERTRENVVEDVKGVRTEAYRLKRKMFLASWSGFSLYEIHGGKRIRAVLKGGRCYTE